MKIVLFQGSLTRGIFGIESGWRFIKISLSYIYILNKETPQTACDTLYLSVDSEL